MNIVGLTIFILVLWRCSSWCSWLWPSWLLAHQGKECTAVFETGLSAICPLHEIMAVHVHIAETYYMSMNVGMRMHTYEYWREAAA
jgi:hypothetical protein